MNTLQKYSAWTSTSEIENVQKCLNSVNGFIKEIREKKDVKVTPCTTHIAINNLYYFYTIVTCNNDMEISKIAEDHCLFLEKQC